MTMSDHAREKKRRHHFVPRFYLRYFADKETSGMIALWNIIRQKYVPKAAISGQAYEIDLYGTDGVIEDGFSIIESKVAPILSKIIETQRLPTSLSQERIWLYLSLL